MKGEIEGLGKERKRMGKKEEMKEKKGGRKTGERREVGGEKRGEGNEVRTLLGG